MDPVAQAVFLSWNFDPWVIVPLLAAAAVYLRGWLSLRRKLWHRFGFSRLGSFQSGLIVLLFATSSPIDAFAGLLLSVHMTQHILLAMVAPPLLLLGMPMLPLFRGLPRLAFSAVVRPALKAPAFRALGALLVRPPIALASFSLATIAWHVPVLYELALRSELWHEIEHICFFGTGLLFWWPVVQPWPGRPQWSGWAMILYLLAADLVNTAVSAVLCFAERILYPTYAVVPALWNISALADQAVAGAIMWVAGSLAFLLPVGWILTRLLEPSLVAPPLKRAIAAPREGRNPQGARPIRPRSLLFSLAILPWHLCQTGPVLAHHATVPQFTQTTGDYVVTLFAESATVHAGPVEFGVLVQTAAGAPVLDAAVAIELRCDGREPLQAVAMRAESANKLIYGAEVALTRGLWQVAVQMQRGEQTGRVTGKLVVEAAHTGPPVWTYVLVTAGVMGAAWITWRKRQGTHP